VQTKELRVILQVRRSAVNVDPQRSKQRAEGGQKPSPGTLLVHL
jgi:hypothetical protein